MRGKQEILIILKLQLVQETKSINTLEGFINRLFFNNVITIYERTALQDYIYYSSTGRLIRTINLFIWDLCKWKKLGQFKKGDKKAMINWIEKQIKREQ